MVTHYSSSISILPLTWLAFFTKCWND